MQITLSNGTTVDASTLDNNAPDAGTVKVLKTIKTLEGGDYNNRTGDNGSSAGAYQWNNDNKPLKPNEVPSHWKNAAREILKDENAPMTPDNQDFVAYQQVNAYKKAGRSPEEIDALWNGAHKDKTSGMYVHNSSERQKKFRDTILGGQTSDTQPNTPKPNSDGYATTAAPLPKNEIPAQDNNQESSLGQQLGQRATDVNTSIGKAGTGLAQVVSGQGGEGAKNIFNGLLQGVGAIAGGLGDVVNKGLELIPGVKQVENLIGGAVGSLAQTDVGKTVAKSIGDFSKDNPELAKDIGAGFNIITAIPILRGLGVVGKLGAEAGSQALKSLAEKSFIKGAPDLIASTKTGARFLEQNPEVLKNMVDRRLVGDIKGGEYITKDAIASSERGVKALNNQVKTILDQPQYATVGQDGNSIAQKAISGYTNRFGKVIEGMPQSGMTPSELIANAKNLDKVNKLLWDKFEAGQANWQEINKLRSALDGKVKKAFIQGVNLDAPEIALSKEFGANLSSAMRDTLQSTIPETQQFFKEMSTQFDIQKALDFMNGKKVVPGGVAKFVGHTAGIGAGGTIGGMIGGAPGAMVGGMAGDRTAGVIANKLAGRNVIQGVLKRTGQNATRVSKKEMIRKLPGLFAGEVNVK